MIVRSGDRSFEDISEGINKMRKHTILVKAASIAVCFGFLLSSTASAFEGSRSQVARDVELTSDGTLHGQIYTSEGRVVENAPIELRYQGTTVARAMTGQNGDFAITGVRGGAHDLSIGTARLRFDFGRMVQHLTALSQVWSLLATKTLSADRLATSMETHATLVRRPALALD